MPDPETILDALAGGMTIRKVAKQFGMRESEVRTILRDAVEQYRDGEYIREIWALADRRLAAVEAKFYSKAIGGDGDPQAAIVFVKTNERRATLNGANHPIGHTVNVMHQAVQQQAGPTSTDRIEQVLAELMITDRSEKPH